MSANPNPDNQQMVTTNAPNAANQRARSVFLMLVTFFEQQRLSEENSLRQRGDYFDFVYQSW